MSGQCAVPCDFPVASTQTLTSSIDLALSAPSVALTKRLPVLPNPTVESTTIEVEFSLVASRVLVLPGISNDPSKEVESKDSS